MSSFREVPASFVPQRSRGHAEVSGNHRGGDGMACCRVNHLSLRSPKLGHHGTDI